MITPMILEYDVQRVGYTVMLIGERERANLVVRLEQFYMYVSGGHTKVFYVTSNLTFSLNKLRNFQHY